MAFVDLLSSMVQVPADGDMHLHQRVVGHTAVQGDESGCQRCRLRAQHAHHRVWLRAAGKGDGRQLAANLEERRCRV